MKLGRVTSTPDARDLKLASYLSASATPPPLMRNWTRGPTDEGVRFSMFQNNIMGNCTCAALGHVDQAAAAQTHRLSTFTDELVIAGYSAIGGYPEHDNGASCRDALRYYRRTGELEHYVRLDADRQQIETAVNLCGGVYVGCDLPLSAQRQAVWDVGPNGGAGEYARRSWGGHAMALLGYDRTGVWFVTWGRVRRATWPFVLTYCDEFWVCISDLWTDPGQLTPGGFDLERLRADVARLAA